MLKELWQRKQELNSGTLGTNTGNALYNYTTAGETIAGGNMSLSVNALRLTGGTNALFTAPTNASGMVLLEVYDAATSTAGPALVNASTR